MTIPPTMTAREKAAWLSKANPYKQPYMWDAFREGARAFWAGTTPEWRGNSRERGAFNKGYQAAASMAERYVVRDALAGQSLDLISRGDRRRRERWEVLDVTKNIVLTVYASKRAATDAARDLNHGRLLS